MFIVNVLLKKMNIVGVPFMCCRLFVFFQLYDIEITLPSQSASILYIQKHSHRRKERDRQI